MKFRWIIYLTFQLEIEGDAKTLNPYEQGQKLRVKFLLYQLDNNGNCNSHVQIFFFNIAIELGIKYETMRLIMISTNAFCYKITQTRRNNSYILHSQHNDYNAYCSDFRYESNGIFVLGVGFFFRQTSTF